MRPRRFAIYNLSVASDWMFDFDPLCYEGKPNVFWIFHCDYMNMHDTVDTWHITEFIKKFLPTGFTEIQPSCFEYNGASANGIQALLDAGFKFNE